MGVAGSGAGVLALDDVLIMLLLETAAVNVLLALHVETTGNVVQGRKLGAAELSVVESTTWREKVCLRGEVSGEVNGTTNISKGREANVAESSVVGNLDSSTDLLEDGDGDVGEGVILINGKTTAANISNTDGGQVWCRNGGQETLNNSQRSSHGVQGWEGDALDLSESQVGGFLKVGELNIQLLAVGINVQKAGDVDNLGAESLQAVVVVDVNGSSGLQVNTIEGAQEGVADLEGLGLGDSGGEGQGGQSWKSNKADASDAGQFGEREGGQESQVVQVELARDVANGAAAKGGQLASILADQVTVDGLWAIDGDGTSAGIGNKDASGNGPAA